jgi:carbon-monoxide dehydrogenase iron sulfur subunit
MSAVEPIWIARDFPRCSGCRLCEVACSLYHEGRIWPEASRVRVFMRVPGAEFPHLCAQCHDYPCVSSCPAGALSVDRRTSAVIVDRDACNSCGACIQACPGRIPFLHPGMGRRRYATYAAGIPNALRSARRGAGTS